VGIEGVNTFIAHGANLNAVDYSGDTPLHKLAKLCQKRDNTEAQIIVGIFIENGAEIMQKNNNNESFMDLVFRYHDRCNSLKEMLCFKLSAFSQLSSDMKKIFTEEKLWDVTFTLYDEQNSLKFNANKSILSARCPKFRGMFESKMSESESNLVSIESQINLNTFKQIFQYLYSGTVEIQTIQEAIDTLQIADEYLLPALKNYCESKLICSLDQSNVTRLIVWSYTYGLDRLKQKSIQWILKDFDRISRTNDFLENVIFQPEIIKDLLLARKF